LAAAQKPRASVQNAYTNAAKLYMGGVPIFVGTDAAGNGLRLQYGLCMHLELYSFVHDVGMPPLDALKSATSVMGKW
jgi:imidazolonepropionase-like amidohydrolase